MESANDQPLMAAGVHNPLSALLIDQLATPEAKEWAAGALYNLSIDPANRHRLVVDGVHHGLSALLRDPQATARAREYAAGALRRLTPPPRGCCVIS